MAFQDCWSQDPSKRPGFEHVIVSIRGLLEGATSKQKLQKTLMGTYTSCCSLLACQGLAGWAPCSLGAAAQSSQRNLHGNCSCKGTCMATRWCNVRKRLFKLFYKHSSICQNIKSWIIVERFPVFQGDVLSLFERWTRLTACHFTSYDLSIGLHKGIRQYNTSCVVPG